MFPNLRAIIIDILDIVAHTFVILSTIVGVIGGIALSFGVWSRVTPDNAAFGLPISIALTGMSAMLGGFIAFGVSSLLAGIVSLLLDIRDELKKRNF